MTYNATVFALTAGPCSSCDGKLCRGIVYVETAASIAESGHDSLLRRVFWGGAPFFSTPKKPKKSPVGRIPNEKFGRRMNPDP